MSHVTTFLAPMSHVKFKKCQCRPVDFRGQGPLSSVIHVCSCMHVAVQHVWQWDLNPGLHSWEVNRWLISRQTWSEQGRWEGLLMEGSPCRMSIIRNANVALSNFRKGCVPLLILRKSRVTLSILRNGPVACR